MPSADFPGLGIELPTEPCCLPAGQCGVVVRGQCVPRTDDRCPGINALVYMFGSCCIEARDRCGLLDQGVPSGCSELSDIDSQASGGFPALPLPAPQTCSGAPLAATSDQDASVVDAGRDEDGGGAP
jgi:hypothetical protein